VIGDHRGLHETLLAGVLTNEADLHWTGDDLTTTGDPTEVALLLVCTHRRARTRRRPHRVPGVRRHPVRADAAVLGAIRTVRIVTRLREGGP
jgi:hypothetical protein